MNRLIPNQSLIIILLLFQAAFISCNKSAGTKNINNSSDSPAIKTDLFEGKIIYSVAAQSSDTNAVNLFYNFSPSQIEVFFSGGKFKIQAP